MTAVFCSMAVAMAVASASVSGRWMPKPGGAATIAVTSDAATMVSGRNSRSVLRIDPPRRAPQQRDEQSINEEERQTKPNLRNEGRRTQRRGGAIQECANGLHRRQRSLDDVQRRHPGSIQQRKRDDGDDGCGAEDQWPCAMRGTFPRRQRQ